MDLFDSPLNLAHQQSRKADKFLNKECYDEAIECHHKATEYLTKAMASTTMQQALESLSLQRESHIRQQVIIREKQRRALQVAKVTTLANKVESAALAQATSSGIIQETGNADETVIARTLDECDSLLQFLNNRTAGSKEAYSLPKQEKSPVENGTKSPKDDKDVIEELRIHNNALQSHILQFLREQEEQHRQLEYYQRELDYSRKETRNLKDRLSKVENPTDHGSPGQNPGHMETIYSMPMALNLDKMPSLNLPPLEMPKFDFDSMKSNTDEEPGSSL